MTIIFFKPKEITANAKCTIHVSGKLGFSKAAMNELGIDDGKYIKIGKDDQKPDDKNFYMMVASVDDGEGFKIRKAGKYFYLNTKHLFDDLMEDYINKKIIYDIQKTDYEGAIIYKLNRREIDRNKKK